MTFSRLQETFYEIYWYVFDWNEDVQCESEGIPGTFLQYIQSS